MTFPISIWSLFRNSRNNVQILVGNVIGASISPFQKIQFIPWRASSRQKQSS